jgi:hypothetical protein
MKFCAVTCIKAAEKKARSISFMVFVIYTNIRKKANFAVALVSMPVGWVEI